LGCFIGAYDAVDECNQYNDEKECHQNGHSVKEITVNLRKRSKKVV
jgi:hypothetical protein